MCLESVYKEEGERTVKGNGDFFGSDDLHGDGLLVGVQIQVFYTRAIAPSPPLVLLVAVAVVPIAGFVGENGAELAVCGRGLALRLFLLLGIRIESREEVTNDEVGYQWLDTSVSAPSKLMGVLDCTRCRYVRRRRP